MGRKLIPPETRTAVLEAFRKGEAAEEIGRRHSLAPETVRRWRREAGIERAAANVAGPDPATVQADIADALKAAHAAAGPEKPAGESPKPEPPKPGATVEGKIPPAQPSGATPAESLLVMIEGVTVAVCRVHAVRLGVRWDDTLTRAAKFTPAERQTLMIFAPAASVWILKLLEHADKIAAGLFALIYWQLLTDRFAVIKARAPRKPQPKKQEFPHGPAGNATGGGAVAQS